MVLPMFETVVLSKGGRPRLSEEALSKAQRQAKYRKKLRESGCKTVQVTIRSPEQAMALRNFRNSMRLSSDTDALNRIVSEALSRLI